MLGIMKGNFLGRIQGDARSLDYSSYDPGSHFATPRRVSQLRNASTVSTVSTVSGDGFGNNRGRHPLPSL